MSDLVLTLREQPTQRVDASPLLSERLAGLSQDEIARLPLMFESGTTIDVGELFTVKGTATDSVRLVGDLSSFDRLGNAMTTGVIHLEGNAGHRAAFRAAGGRLNITGDAGNDTGMEMSGGVVVVKGSVGQGTGSTSPGAKRGMSGGEIVVFGDAGRETGACLRRGVIAVAGRIGPNAARTAIAGTVLAGGGFDAPYARWLKRASLVSLTELPTPPGFLTSCVYRPSFLAVLLLHLQRSYGFPVTAEQIHGLYRQDRGDMAELGRGEILSWTGK